LRDDLGVDKNVIWSVTRSISFVPNSSLQKSSYFKQV
jgi:hypothetical protein